MGSFSRRFIALFASPLGLFVLAALDSSVLVSLPFGIDALVIIVAARQPHFWIVPLLATAGSATGAALTFWLGVKIGEKGLARHVPRNRLEQIRARVKKSGAVALASLSLIPPPFPFTPFVLAAGALEVRTVTFFTTFVLCRMVRFGIEAALAARYGRRILQWLASSLVQELVGWCFVLAVAVTVVSLMRFIRSTRSAPRKATA